jgi:hypothetical protein
MTPSVSWIQGLANTESDGDLELAAMDAPPCIVPGRAGRSAARTLNSFI